MFQIRIEMLQISGLDVSVYYLADVCSSLAGATFLVCGLDLPG